MDFRQETIIKNVDTLDIIRSFHNYKFINFLTIGQPVKINSWTGIYDGKRASFSFWFFGWKKMAVRHQGYEVGRHHLHFVDVGEILPFGLKDWEHHHIVKSHGSGSVIIDEIKMDKSSFVKKYVVLPIMLLPVLIRKVTYKIWFYSFKGKLWQSFKK